ncbi:hypothetical protein GXW82_41445 [Streptacidiphilus sp. 4-A2]|nr:hypothetical protein [Streptacidiphilus sp. 4-A2]
MEFQVSPECDGALHRLVAEGVSPWLSGVGRETTATGRLARLIAESGIRGACTDVAGMAPIVAGSGYYDQQLADLAARGRVPGRP